MYTAILSSRPHNLHYLQRYLKFIQGCIQRNENHLTSFQAHHVCPKANDMFPEYRSFRKHPWNKAKLTARQHFIAHWMLMKVYDSRSQKYAFNQMLNFSGRRSSRVFETFNAQFKRYLSADISNRTGMGVKGTLFIFNPQTEQFKRIKKTDPIPTGWVRQCPSLGRVQDKHIKTFHDPATQKEYKIDIRHNVPENLVPGRSHKFKAAVRASSLGNAANKGKKTIHNPTTGEMRHIDSTELIPEGFVYGVSNETKQRMSDSKKNLYRGDKNPMFGTVRSDRYSTLVVFKDGVEIVNIEQPAVDNVKYAPRKLWNIGVITESKLKEALPRSYSKSLHLIGVEIRVVSK